MRNGIVVRGGVIQMRWFALIAGILAVLAGCGGGGSSSPSGTVSTTGRATFTIQWPGRSRLIPVGANSIRVRISSPSAVLAEQVLPRPSAGGTVKTTLNGITVGQYTLTAHAYPEIDGTGTAQATATSPITIQPGKTTAMTLSLESTIDHLEVAPSIVSVTEDTPVPLTATAKDAADAVVLTSAFTWSSSDTSVATVNSAGVMTSVVGAAGKSTTITVTETESGKSASVMVHVVAHTVSTLQKATTYQINPSHSGFLSMNVPWTFPSSPTWSVDLGESISYPLIANGRVYVTTRRPGGEYGTRLYALSAGTGEVLWGPITINGTYSWSGLTYDNGKVFVVNFEGTLRSFDAATGAPGWSVQLPGQYAFSAAPNAVNGAVYVGGAGSGGTLYSVNAANGAINWTASVQNGDQSSPSIALDDDGVFVSYPCQVYRFNARTGAQDWHYDGPCSGGGGKTTAYRNGLLYVRDNSIGSIGAGTIYNALNGSVVGSFSAGPIPALSATIDAVMTEGTLRGQDAATHETLWSFAGDGQLTSAPIIVNNTVIVGSGSGMVYALNAATGTTVWSNSAGAGILAPDEQNVSQPLTGLAVGEGYLVVPAGNWLTAWCFIIP